MKKAELHRKIRKSHRYLGVALGVQFLFWTLGGLYFSWSNMDEIHGDPQKRPAPLFDAGQAWVSPTMAIDALRKQMRVDSIVGIQMAEVLGDPVYQIHFTSREGNSESFKRVQLADARTGTLRPPLTQAEAVRVASLRFNGEPTVTEVELLTETNGHHEYREQPLPAYAVTFASPGNTTVYVSAQLGTVQKYRNNKWRVFDFLWMLHTMDYQSRDNLGNWLLRAFSIFGLLTVASGFGLYFLSRKKKAVAQKTLLRAAKPG
ncbi:MAG: hypothetical protein KKG00_16540 [Bacteroidetes bacterium]|nr:hypothetical protein [Bacteroidota bacterium]